MSQSTTPTQLDVEPFVRFLDRYYEDEIGELVQNYPSEQRSLEVSWRDLFRYSELPHVTEDLRNGPRHVIETLEAAIERYDVPVDIQLTGVNVRIVDLPDTEVKYVDKAWQLGIGEYTGISGQVKKVSGVSKEPIEVAFECQRCGTLTRIPQSGHELQEPHECMGCEREGPFSINYEQSRFRPHQMIRLQQPPEETKGGDGSSIDVHIRDDQVNNVSAGDRVTMNGVYSVKEPSGNQEMDFEEYLDSNSVDFAESDYDDIDVDEYEDDIIELASGDQGDIYELLKDSIAPKIYGYDKIKEAIVLQLFGGIKGQYPDSTEHRGDFHILLLGDPGTAKSSLLRSVEELAPRSVYASGKGASAAGMTAAAVSDDFGDSEWSLEAGALVLANKGIACVDEIDKVKDDAISSMHDALESQRVTINKAGINATMPAETSLLAAGNPKYGRFDDSEGYADQIELGPTMMSRFDLMFMVSDSPDEEKDREIAEQIVETRQLANAYTENPDSVSDDAIEEIEPAIDTDLMRAYIAYAKEEVTPRIRDEDVAQNLVDSYANFRGINDYDGPVPITARKLEAIQRLAEASARARLSSEVEMQDVDRARDLIGESLRQVGMDPETGEFDADIVETNMAYTQSERIRTIEKIIRNQSGKDPAEIDKVIEEAVSRGIDEQNAQEEINMLKTCGDAYSPQTDCVRLTD